MADLGRERSGVTYFGVEDDSQALPELQHAADSKHCRNCGHAYEYDAIYLGHMGRYRCPNCGRDAARAAGRRHAASTLDGMSRLARRAAHARRATSRSDLPAPRPLQRLQRRRRGGDGARARRAARDGRRGARGLRRRVRARGDDPRGRPQVSILLIKNPAGANEVLRTLILEDGAARPLDRAQRPDRRRPRRLLDLGRRLRGARGPRPARDLQRHARGGDGAAAEVRRDRGRARGGPRPRAVARRRAWRTPPATASTRCPPTRRCSSCATCWPSAASRRGGRNDERVRGLARRGERLLRRRPRSVAGAGGRRARPGTGPRVPAPAALPPTSRRAGTRSSRSTRTPSCWP